MIILLHIIFLLFKLIMKNEDQNLNTRLSKEEENLNIDQISKSKNNFDNNN